MLCLKDSSHGQRHSSYGIRMEIKYHSLGTHIQGGFNILISDRVDLKSKLIKRFEECHLILLMEIIHQ